LATEAAEAALGNGLGVLAAEDTALPFPASELSAKLLICPARAAARSEEF
jgi:hypothetical protein